MAQAQVVSTEASGAVASTDIVVSGNVLVQL